VTTAAPFAPSDLRGEVVSFLAEWKSSPGFEVRSDAWLRSFDLDFSREAARRGYVGMTWPRLYGGSERSNVERLCVTEEMLRASAPVAAHWIGDRQIGPSVLRHGSPELCAEILPMITDGTAVFCLGMSEPEAGSDLAAVSTRAEPTDGGWRLNGRKVWTSHAHRATHMYVLARTEATGNRHEGLTEFIVDMRSPGILVSPIEDMTGAHHFNEVLLEDVFVPSSRVLGDVGAGWRQVLEQLSFERGGAERILSTYPLLIELIQRTSSTDESLQVVGRLVARLAVLRRLCWQVAEALDRGAAPVREAAALKYLGTAFEYDVVESARVLDGSDPARGSQFAQALLAAPGFSIRGGATEVLLSLISRLEVSHV
jgi:acyl-CoA dehydrogenase